MKQNTRTQNKQNKNLKNSENKTARKKNIAVWGPIAGLIILVIVF